MNFDELWRVKLDQQRARGDSVKKTEAVGLLAVPGENANKLPLTAEDCVFLSAFSQQGFAATSTDDLMRAMDIGRQSMYDTFGFRDQLSHKFGCVGRMAKTCVLTRPNCYELQSSLSGISLKRLHFYSNALRSAAPVWSMRILPASSTPANEARP
jgi:hypothetical protein